MPRRLLVTVFALVAMLFSLQTAQAGMVSSGTFKMAKTQIASGTSTVGVISLTANATSTQTFNVSSENTDLVTVPATVKILKGKKSINVPITAGYSTSSTKVTINVTNDSNSLSASITILPLKVVSVAFSPESVRSGTTAKATVKLNGPAPSAGKSVKITTSGPLKAPTTVKVPAGKTSATVTVNTKEVLTSTTGKLTADLKGKVTANLTVVPLKVKSVAVNTSTVDGGDSVIVTITMDGKAPAGGIEVEFLASGLNEPGNPETLEIAEGSTSLDYEYQTPESGSVSGGSITFTATYNEGAKSAILNIRPIGQLQSVTASDTSINVNEQVTISINLTNEPYAEALTYRLTITKEGGSSNSENGILDAAEASDSFTTSINEPGVYTFSVTYMEVTKSVTITVTEPLT